MDGLVEDQALSVIVAPPSPQSENWLRGSEKVKLHSVQDTEKFSAGGKSDHAFPPANFPRSEQSRSARRQTDAHIFLSWGGEVYGPATEDEIVAGLRSSWFEKDAMYWHEGLAEWKPLESYREENPGRRSQTERLRRRGESRNIPLRSRRRQSEPNNRPKASKPRVRSLDRRGRLVVVSFAVLAVIATVGILLLLALT